MFQPEYEERLLRCSSNGNREELELRFIPQRSGNNWRNNFALKEPSLLRGQVPSAEYECSHNSGYACLLRNELLNTQIASMDACKLRDRTHSETGELRASTRLYGYQVPAQLRPLRQPFSVLSEASTHLLSMPIRPSRKLPRLPYKILDAPELQDDFYLNLIDWASSNMLGVGLGCSVYLWNANSGQVTRLCDLSHENNPITSVSWHKGGQLLAVGTMRGYISIWDAIKMKQLSKLDGHAMRIGALSWRGDSLCSGSRDGEILQRDTRTTHIARRLRAHRQEVCGLQWSPSGQYLASGGNDNVVNVWTNESYEPLHSFRAHKAAVKALAWSPLKSGLLATGGGAADRCLRFWNALNGQPLQCIDTGSQISNLGWAQYSSELVTTHSYGQPQLIVWGYPNLQQIVRLSGHMHRVVYLALSPDGESVVTGAGDETLRFWSLFPKKETPKLPKSVLSLHCDMR